MSASHPENPTPLPPLDDWLTALRDTQLPDAVLWVTSEDGVVIDATPGAADAAGIPIGDFLGLRRTDPRLNRMILSPPEADRHAEMDALLREGGCRTRYLAGRLPDQAVARFIVTTVRLVRNHDGRKFLLHIAHDITEIDSVIGAFSTPALQNMIGLYIDRDGRCQAATQGAARFCGESSPEAMVGVALADTEYADMVEREHTRVADSRRTGEPSEDIEWLMSADGACRAYAVTRIGLQHGAWVVMLTRVTSRRHYLQRPVEDILKRSNFSPPKITPARFDCLVDLAAGLNPDEAARLRNRTPGAISDMRNKLAHKVFKVGHPRRIMPLLAGTPLDALVNMYAREVDLNACWGTEDASEDTGDGLDENT